jgi:hypothetical protein
MLVPELVHWGSTPGDLVEAFLTKVPWATGTVGFQSVPKPSRKDRMHVSMLSYEKAPYTNKDSSCMKCRVVVARCEIPP